MSERGMSEVMTESRGFGEILVQTQSACYRTGNLSYLERVCKAGAVMVSLWCEKDLHFMHKAAKAFAVDDAVSVALEIGPYGAFVDRADPSARILNAKCLFTKKRILEIKGSVFKHTQKAPFRQKFQLYFCYTCIHTRLNAFLLFIF
jgi:hypothetical protein